MFRYSGYCFAALAGGAVAAFWPQYLARPLHQSDAYTHVHALAMAGWCGLLIAQPFLIRGERRSLHRALGALSYGVAPLVVVASLLLAHSRFRVMDPPTFAREARNLYLPLSALALFGITYGFGIAYRRQPALHARFMICTALTMVDPVLGRILFFYGPPLPGYLYYQAITFGLVDAILLALAVRDGGQARVRWAFPAMLGVFAGAHVLWFTLAQSEWWLGPAAWFRRLPLT
jgi:hypothetical protein